MVLEIIEIGAEIHRMIDPIIEGKILAKGMIKDIDIEVLAENVTDPDQGIEALQEKTLEIGIEIIKVEAKKDKGQELLQTERDARSRSRSSPQVSTNRDRLRCYRCNEYDYFARASRKFANATSRGTSNGLELFRKRI